MTDSSTLTWAIEHDNDLAVVKCTGRLVAGVHDRFYQEVQQLMPGSKHVVLDFTELTHVDSTGIGTLVRLYVHSKSNGCTFELINIGKPVRQLLGVTHLLSVLAKVGENNIRMG